jgi:hypothetical protein
MRAKSLTLAALATAVLVVAHRRVLGIVRRPSWPPPPDAVTSDGAQSATEAFAARATAGPRDAALDFAWSTAATLEPWADGENFFPRILADVEAARSSVHILMFGWREGEVGMQMAALLERKLAERVEVRVIVDGIGSRPYMQARELSRGSPRRARRSSSTTSALPSESASSPPAGRYGASTSSDGPTIASCTSSTGTSPGPAAPASRTTSTTAASTT